MKISTRMTVLYTIMLMLILTIMFIFIYAAFSGFLFSDAKKDIAQDALLIAGEIELDDGILEVDLDEDDLEELRSDSLFLVYSLDGQVLARNHNYNWIEEIPRDAENSWTIKHGNIEWLLHDKTVYEDGVEIAWLRIAMPLSGINEMTTLLRFFLILGVPISLILSLVCSQLIAKRALAPISNITHTAQEIAGGDLSRRLDFVDTGDEVSELAKTFDYMLDNVEEAFLREKQFSSDASHEMRTPIAVIIAHAQTALSDKDADAETYRNALNVIQEKGKDIHRMLSQLLLLSRSYEDSSVLELQKMNLNEVIEDIADEMSLNSKDKDISIELNLEKNVYMDIDLMLFTRMMINLLDNAVKYGKEHGHIWIELFREDSSVNLLISDDGEGISQDDLPHLFKRFYRSDRSRSSQGFGLGLAISAWVVSCHGGKIAVESKIAEGTRFVISFPNELSAVNI